MTWKNFATQYRKITHSEALVEFVCDTVKGKIYALCEKYIGGQYFQELRNLMTRENLISGSPYYCHNSAIPNIC